MQKRGGEKGRERGGWEGKDNSFCSAGERLKGGGRKRKKKKEGANLRTQQDFLVFDLF